MEKYLVFRLYGPMASWGQAAVGGDRPTGQQPTRSAVTGLLAAALGIRRDEASALASLSQRLKVAVKQLTTGSLLRDYHTTQVPSQKRGARWATRQRELQEDKINTVLSNRDYRCDGLWIVSVQLAGEGDLTLDGLAAALTAPVFSLYLGRKSCPVSSPLCPQVIDASDVKQALDTQFPPLVGEGLDKFWLSLGNSVTYFWEGDATDFPSNQGGHYTTRPWDRPLDRSRWQFGQRDLHQITIQEDV